MYSVESVFSNLQKITCIILRNLFGIYLFSHQSCATGTLLLQKKIYPRKSSLNLKQLIFFMLLNNDIDSVLQMRLSGFHKVDGQAEILIGEKSLIEYYPLHLRF